MIVSSGRSVGNVGLATELHDLAEDIVAEDVTADDSVFGQTVADPMATVATMKSEPTQKVFTQTRSMTYDIFDVRMYEGRSINRLSYKTAGAIPLILEIGRSEMYVLQGIQF